ncbi:peptidoglycan DD-metalloendopeptidase family protein [Idiomarina abyssalis]|uniref:Peptidoglycan DD-metalloendopeptidase family protein n=1 Tax=Idiomarina abyssalis TaxID=86102 RepID=A0A8I1GD11_9GAMM|nr:peptidoglycan DD-metalloendopeptidase family protein [Idiomarina abyssalis]MBJ7266975.1 peptidoglycan DD-metalloendopeptidase family protein [Idiomarina abyssalis]MBJ7272615.1 peptidoglycan DD-metalloendopeptidase family protein [Idiomarina abyssalis]MBJ7316467.1 peptidoglycan DD-metalloendopeptidase family protein [Idiomarina abyssalis]MDA6067579.1 peptidoglycan DD-metalloendopeptidase family protein [Idiomarina abyssalis]
MPLPVFLLIVLGLLVNPAVAQDYSEDDKASTEAEIAAVKEELAERLQAIEERNAELSSTEQQLRDLEIRTAEVAGSLRKTQTKLDSVNAEIAESERKRKELQQKQKQQMALLEDQLVSAYMNGDHDFLKMLLNQQDPGQFERMLSYYQYFNTARVEEIKVIKSTQQEIVALTEELKQQQNQLAALRQQQEEQRSQLEQQQHRQEEKLAELQQQQRKDRSRVGQLEQSRDQLEQVLSAIENALAQQKDVQLVGLQSVKNQLRWPSDGDVKRVFGQRREGPVDWKGVLIEGSNGQPVRSIANGRVVYADWLRGFGLVIVVDHGQSYMSLYGHNQTLTKAVGDKVRKDEEIALMGQSGSRNSPTLYFEIRHQGRPQNPSNWIR